METAENDAGSEYDSTDDSDDEDSGMQGQARPVHARRFPKAVVDEHAARVQAVQLQESDDDEDVPDLLSSSNPDDTSGSESADDMDEVDVQASKFVGPSDAFLQCNPNGQQVFELYEERT